MLKKIFLVLGLIIIGILGYAAIQSPDYEVSRQITINAPAEKVFPYLNNSKLGDQWSPWKESDPSAQFSFSGPDDGVGSRTTWTGGQQLGTGSATITESVPNEKVSIRLEYTEPMAMAQDADYLLVSGANGESILTWNVRGKNGFIGRVMCLFFDMDKMVGGMFEKGLTKLKTLVEAAP